MNWLLYLILGACLKNLNNCNVCVKPLSHYTTFRSELALRWKKVISQQNEVQEEVGSSGDSSRDLNPAASHPKKKPEKITDLTDEEEEVMALWIRENECLYNKKLNAYKDMQQKNKLWDDQAKEMNKDMEMLQIWYRSLRTRYAAS